MSLSFTMGASTITVFLDGQIHTVEESHANYEPLKAELRKDPKDRDLNAIRPLVSIKRMVEAQSVGNVEITEDAVLYKGQRVAKFLEARMLDIIGQGIGIEPWAFFIENLYENPSETAIAELYEWLDKGKLPLTPDGHFIAFKKVGNKYMDCHTGKFDNSVGNILEMDRSLCDPNRHNHCSTGFHFASVGYLSNFGGTHVMAVKINPRDVTAIPADYKTTKGRCCRYEVVAELQNEAAAKNGAWAKKAVVDLEDPQEFPDLLVKQIMGEGEKPKKKTVTKSNGDKPVSKKTVKDKKVPAKKVAKAAKSSSKTSFTTTTGKTFTKAQVVKALKGNSGRAAARLLGIGESTLRGWKKALGL